MTETELMVRVRFRLCREEDLPALEWMGLHTRDRPIIAHTFAAQERGAAMMLIGDAGGYPVAQVWIDPAERGTPECPHLWAVRVFPPLQGAGLGTSLMAEAERRIVESGARRAELSVERDDAAVRRFYERLGYRPAGSPQRLDPAIAPPGDPNQVQQVFRKELVPA